MNRAFTRVELLALLAVAGIGASLLAIGASETRAASKLASSTANLQSIGVRSFSFAADRADQTPVFSWRGGVVPDSQFADLRAQAAGGNDIAATGAQAVDIIRRRSNQPAFPVQANWIPHIAFSHLVLADYAAQRLPSFDFISPADPVTLSLARQNVTGSRVGFASSYEWHPFLWQQERRSGGLFQGVTQASTHSTFQTPSGSGVLGPRRFSELRFPSQKAIVYDKAQRHFGATIYFAFPQARSLVLAGDGHVAPRAAALCTPGFRPETPTSLAPMTYTYQPLANEPPAPGGSGSGTVNGQLRWTRGGLEGRDFDGRNISTSGW